MTPTEPLVKLHHGTTKQRAEAILRNGPNPNFKEPGGFDPAGGFSTARPEGPFPTGSPEILAHGKAAIFPDEGGPAIIEIEVPESIVAVADLESEVRFIPGFGLEELLTIWADLSKRIIEL